MPLLPECPPINGGHSLVVSGISLVNCDYTEKITDIYTEEGVLSLSITEASRTIHVYSPVFALMRKDYVPESDAAFDDWVANFAATVVADPVAFGETALSAAELSAALGDWGAKFPAHVAAQNAARSARQAKKESRLGLEAVVRPMVRRIQARAETEDSDRALLGIRIRDGIRTRLPAPTTRPIVSVAIPQRLRHRIRFSDETTPTLRRKPFGARGCEVWVKIGGPPPADPTEMRYLGTLNGSPSTIDFEGEHGGQTAHYMLRWIGNRGEPGPWSETASATIGA